MSWVAVGVGISALISGYSVNEGIQARKKSERQQEKLNAEQLKLEGELKDRELNEQRLEASKVKRDKQRRVGIDSAKGGTVLTGSLGIQGPPSSGPKTVLGA